MVTPPTIANNPLLLIPILHRAFPDVKSYTIENNIVQANAEGFCININDTNDASDNSNDDNSNSAALGLFVKCVEASKYAHKPWSDLRRTLLYSRTEARFYSDILPLLREEDGTGTGTGVGAAWDIAPKCYLAESYLEGLIGEEESATAKQNEDDEDPTYDETNNSILRGKGGNLILQSLSTKDGYYQTSPLSIQEASLCLTAAAKFHASAFENEQLLQSVSNKLCEYGGSYHLKNRNPKELVNICKTWDDFVENILVKQREKEAAAMEEDQKSHFIPEDFLDREDIRNIGQRIYTIAEYVSNELSPAYNDKYATIVHGDYKAMNVFLPQDKDKYDDSTNTNEALLIDFASTGVGMGVSDVAMLITHAVHPTNLANGGEQELVDGYFHQLQKSIPKSKRETYSQKEVFLRHYRLATVDYFRFVLGRLWRGATLESFEKKKNSKNAVLVSRNVEAAVAFIERVNGYVKEIEKEMNMI